MGFVGLLSAAEQPEVSDENNQNRQESGANRIRTDDLCSAIAALYQLSYSPARNVLAPMYLCKIAAVPYNSKASAAVRATPADGPLLQ